MIKSIQPTLRDIVKTYRNQRVLREDEVARGIDLVGYFEHVDLHGENWEYITRNFGVNVAPIEMQFENFRIVE